MELPRGSVLLLAALLALATAARSLETCECTKNKRTSECYLDKEMCLCKSIGFNITVNCRTLTSKCLLMKAEVTSAKRGGRGFRPEKAYVDNDGIYDPECDASGKFKPKQCNGTDTCWCVNSAGVRRTEKGDKNIICNEVVRTSWIIIETKHLDRKPAPDENSIVRAIGDTFSEHYQLDQKHISVMYEEPFITVYLKQNASENGNTGVDIADVAYYFEKDVKGDPVSFDNFGIEIAGKPLQFENTQIYYVDDKPPEFSMKRLTAGIIAVIVIIVLAVVAGILVLVFTRRKRGKYEKAEIKEMNEMHRELNS